MELKEKYDQKYTAQQLRLWANMLQVGTWKDRETPHKTLCLAITAKLKLNTKFD